MNHQPPSTYILRYFVDVEVLPQVSWMPQTLGWKILAVLLLCLTLIYAYQRLSRWYLNRYRREAIQAIDSLSGDNQHYGRELFYIMKVVLSHLSSKNNHVFGDTFFTALALYHSESLEDQLQHAWTHTLVSDQVSLTAQQKQQLKTYCYSWLQHHKAFSYDDI
jgi:uncharacterized membrane protein